MLTEEDLYELRLSGFNDGIQAAVKRILEAAERASSSCRCKAMSMPEIAAMLETIAYNLDSGGVVRESNAEAGANSEGVFDKKRIAMFKRAAKRANKGRRYIVKKASQWRRALGFEPDANPSEQEINKAYKDKAKEVHPDRPDTSSPAPFQRIQAAHEQALEEIHGPKPPCVVKPPPAGRAEPPEVPSRCAICGGKNL